MRNVGFLVTFRFVDLGVRGGLVVLLGFAGYCNLYWGLRFFDFSYVNLFIF